jgi:hypothetical protein
MARPRCIFKPHTIGKQTSRLIFINELLKRAIHFNIRKDLPPVQEVTRVMHPVCVSKFPCRIGWPSISSDQKWHMNESEILPGGLP